MTDAAGHGSRSGAGSSTPYAPAPGGPAGDWDGDHVRDAPGQDRTAAGATVDDDAAEQPDIHEIGIDPAGLADDDLLRELGSLHRTRLHTLRHGPEAALANHLRRTAQLEAEYLTRHPGREVDPSRLTQEF